MAKFTREDALEYHHLKGKPGKIAIEHGKSLNKVEDLRLIADYRGDPVTMVNAAWALEQATNFLEAVRALQSSN